MISLQQPFKVAGAFCDFIKEYLKCRNTGLRRFELEHLKGENFEEKGSKYNLKVSGKVNLSIGDIGSLHLRCVFVETDIFPHRGNLILNVCNFTAVFI